MKLTILKIAAAGMAALFLALAWPSRGQAADAAERWTAERAWEWYNRQAWMVGCNFLPSTAVNDVEMWQQETFDQPTIDRELGWAQGLGFNSVRVFINYVVWEADPNGCKKRFAWFLSNARQHGLRVMPILFDDCFKPEPQAGPQPDPVPGEHNSQWVCSPGASRVAHTNTWGRLEQYVTDMVSSFGRDEQIIFWDLYNEPTRSLPLVEATFRWARAAQPIQPLTMSLYGSAAMQRRIAELSDIISFHNYNPLPNLQAEVTRHQGYGRPLVCTEWMTRIQSSLFQTHLPFFQKERIGCWNWGLVAGRTQTYYPWGSPQGAPEPKVWHHDIFRKNGAPYDAREVRLIKAITGVLPYSVLAPPEELVPTAERQPVPWRYTLEPPAGAWFQPGFDAAAWRSGSAPFGREESPLGRLPNTVWTNADLWLRREFTLPPDKLNHLVLRWHHDEEVEVYVNGVLAAQAPGYNAAYELMGLSAAAQAGLKPGTNLLAVHCRQTTGGQYLDVGLVREVPEPQLPPLQPLFDYPLRDTSVCLGPDAQYYLTGTTGHPTWWQTNAGIRVWKSADLKTWEPLGLVWSFERNATWQKRSADGHLAIWAPEIHYIKGTFWLAYCVNYGGTGLLKSTSGQAQGPYVDVKPDGPLTTEIDASLFADDDGRVYFVYQNGKLARLKDDLSGLAETPHLLAPSNARQVGFEGAFLFKAKGRYYLSCAEFLHGQYHCLVASAASLHGPYGPRSLAIPQGGHNMFFQDKTGQWWSTIFGNDYRAPFRERPGILRVEFEADGRVQPLLAVPAASASAPR